MTALNYDDLFGYDPTNPADDPIRQIYEIGTKPEGLGRARRVADYAGAYASDAWNSAKTHAPTVLRHGGRLGKAGLIGAGVWAGGRFIAYPLVKGFIDPDIRYGAAKNPIGRFVTGEDPNNPDLMDVLNEENRREKIAENKKLIDEERAYQWQAYKDKVAYDQQAAYNHAQDMSDLELGVLAVRDQDALTASLLENSMANYLRSMQIANNSVANILGNKITLQ